MLLESFFLLSYAAFYITASHRPGVEGKIWSLERGALELCPAALEVWLQHLVQAAQSNYPTAAEVFLLPCGLRDS